MQAAEWYVWAIAELPSEYHAACLIIAHEHARDLDYFLPLYHTQAAKDEALKMARTIDATAEEVELVLELLNPAEAGEVASEEPTDFESAVTRLVAQTNIPPDVWRARVSLSYIARQAQALNEMNGDKKPANDYIQAERDVGLALMEIRKEHKDGA